MKKHILFLTSLAIMACGRANHNEEHDVHEHSEAEHSHTEEEENSIPEITFTPQTAALGTFAVEKVEKGPFFGIIKTSGRSISSPAGESAVVAPSNGIIMYNSHISEGININAKEVLMSISSKKIADGDAYTQISTEYYLAKRQWERAEKLIIDRIISQSECDATKADYLKKKNAFDALHTDKNGDVAIKSPFSGYVKDVKATPGAYVSKGDILCYVVKNNRARLEIDVPQKYFSKMGDVVSATFTSDEGKTYDTALLNGRTISYSKSVSTSGMLSMTIEYDGVSDLPEGAFVKVSLRLKSNGDVLTVPMSAITEEQGEHFAYIRLDEECYQKCPVSLGDNDELRTVVTTGLSENDTVVTKGTYRVKLAGNTGAIPHSHEH